MSTYYEDVYQKRYDCNSFASYNCSIFGVKTVSHVSTFHQVNHKTHSNLNLENLLYSNIHSGSSKNKLFKKKRLPCSPDIHKANTLTSQYPLCMSKRCSIIFFTREIATRPQSRKSSLLRL